jgi:hypothetical protein
VFGGTQSGVGYLRVWEGQGQWFLLGEFLHCGNKKKLHANETKVFLGFFGQILPYLQGKLLKVVMLRYYIHKSHQYKTGF